MVLTTVLSMMRYVSEIDDRDFVDRLSSYFTTNLLIGLAVLVSFKQFGGKPMECLTPDIFSSSWEQYTENYCWAQDTYFVSPRAIVDGMEPALKNQKRISYYQWVPFFLLLEAICFRLPSIAWKYLAGHSGIKIQEIIKLSSDPNNIKPDIRRSNIRSLSTHLQGALRFHRRINRKQIRPHGGLWMLNLPYSARYVTCIYIFTKLAYLANVLFQLVLMNSFLETHRYSFYGFGAMVDMLNGTTWEQSGIFPRVSLCDFEVRVMGNIQEYTIQCVLVINIFNEKIFVFLWFWYMCVLILTFGSCVFWFGVSVSPYLNRRFIIRHLEMGELSFDTEANEKLIDRFVHSYLRADGVFVIRMLTLHSGVIFGTDLVLALWQNYFGVEFQHLKRGNSVVADLDRISDDEMDAEVGAGTQNQLFTSKQNAQLRQRQVPQASQEREIGAFTKSAIAQKTRGLQMVKEKLITPPLPPADVLRAVASPDESRSTSRSPTPPVSNTDGNRRRQYESNVRRIAENERLLSDLGSEKKPTDQTEPKAKEKQKNVQQSEARTTINAAEQKIFGGTQAHNLQLDTPSPLDLSSRSKAGTVPVQDAPDDEDRVEKSQPAAVDFNNIGLNDHRSSVFSPLYDDNQTRKRNTPPIPRPRARRKPD